MGFKDVMAFLSPYLGVFLCIIILICCFIINYTTPSSIEVENVYLQQMDYNQQRQEIFGNANINRLELAESMTNYAIYLKEKMERERIKEEQDIIYKS